MTQPIRALVVDDYPDAAEALARLLETMGCTASFVTDSKKAVETASAMSPQVVFIDIGMPDINGFELAAMLRERYGKSLRLVAATAYGGTAVHEMCREAGFDAHVHKPVAIASLHRTLEAIP